MEQIILGQFGDRRLEKGGEFLHRRLVKTGCAQVRKLGGDRAGEIRITRFIRNAKVSTKEILHHAQLRTLKLARGRHILAIQDTTDLGAERLDHKGTVLHPTLAVDAVNGSVLGLVGAEILHHDGGKRATRKKRAHADKESARWLRGIESTRALIETGEASRVTVIADREGDIYEDFAFCCQNDRVRDGEDRPPRIDIVARASKDRYLADGDKLFSFGDRLEEAGQMSVTLPSAPGRKAQSITLSISFSEVTIARPRQRASAKELAALPESLSVTLVEAREINPPEGRKAAHWRLLTSHSVHDLAAAQQIIAFYRQRWTIEQLFRTMKGKGFDVEAIKIGEDAPFEKLAIAVLIAAITVMQLVHEREGKDKRPLEDVFYPEDSRVLEHLSMRLEGKTEKQKNPHPKNSLAFATWVLARLGGWTGYYGKPGPIVIYGGLVQYQAIKMGWTLGNV